MKKALRPFAPSPRGLPFVRALAAIALGCIATAALAGGCGNENALVGGECITGYSECNLQCVNLSNDLANCGGCGITCGSGVKCISAVCGGPLDGSLDGTLDGSQDGFGDTFDKDRLFPDGEPEEAETAVVDSTPPDVVVADVGPDVPVDSCAPPYNTAARCGDCFTTCSGVNDTCVASDGGFVCAPLCTAPLSNCGGVCVDLTSDTDNCGVCGKFCSSNLCIAGVCQGTVAGDVVVIGHDYVATPLASTQGRVLSNAVFISRRNPVRVMSYERYVDANALASVKGILAAAAVQLNRTINYTVTTTDADIPNNLTTLTQDVLLVYDQQSAGPGVLGTLGTSWATALDTFTKGGGVVVALDGAAGTTREMPQFLTNSALLAVTAHTTITLGQPLNVAAPSNVVGVGVLSPYGASNRSARFTTVANGGLVTYVVRDSVTSDPVVIHRTTP